MPKKKQARETTVSTELFKDKVVPAFLKEHRLFRNPTNIQKIFPSIGLPNFADKVNIEKSFVDIKKENSYVHHMLRTIADIIIRAKAGASELADKIQFLSTKEEREASRAKLVALYEMAGILAKLGPLTDPYEGMVLNDTIHVIDGKVVLKLSKDITVDDTNKVILRQGEPLFRVLNKIKEKCASLGVVTLNLEQTEAFKIFSKENMPNKEFSIIFSSEGNQGAWDIATMSMRGIKSCQRWDGEYPRCLVGSIFSKFVGIIYLTSGVPADVYGSYKDLGTKMIRRCVVRYAVDTDENKPCILVDKMYPEHDKDVLALFIKSLSNRTSLPVHYAPELGNKTKHIYLPSEKIREEISDRDWSYQDTPLKTKNDINIYLLSNSKEELEREIRGFSTSFSLFFAQRMDNVYSDLFAVNDEVRKTVRNLKMNVSFTQFAALISSQIISLFKIPDHKGFINSKKYYREYLLSLLRNRKTLQTTIEGNIGVLLRQNISRVADAKVFVEFVFSSLVDFIKSEIKKVGN